MQQSTKAIGNIGEEVAGNYLAQNHYIIRERQWRFKKYEVDIIAEIDNSIVFIEVKTRYSNAYGEPWEAVNQAKRKRLIESANAYIQRFACSKEPRFDIISIIKSNNKCTVDHIENAFTP